MNEKYYEKYEQRYQAVYAAGADLWGYAPDNEALGAVISDWVEKNGLKDKAILETCCGEGGAGVVFSKLGCRYYGVDAAPSAIGTAKRLLAPYENGKVEVLDLVTEKLHGKYDAAFDAMGFHMLLTDDHRMAYLENLFQCLKPGAPVLLFREAYQPDAFDGQVDSYEKWMEIVGGGYDEAVKKYAKKGKENVEVLIPRMPGRHKSEKGYREELESAGFMVDDFQVERGWNGATPFATIWARKSR